MTQSEATYYQNGFHDGKHMAARSILNTISILRIEVKERHAHADDIVDAIEKLAVVLNGGKQDE